MNCTYCEERMSDLLEGTLDAAERVIVEEHLRSCPDCRGLMTSMSEILGWSKSLPIHEPPAWLAARIVANTPRVVRITWRDLLGSVWSAVSEPRIALGVFTTILMLGWLGSMAGISPDVGMMVRHPSSIYFGAEGWVTRMYGDAVRNYYRSPLVNAIQCQIHTRIEQLKGNS